MTRNASLLAASLLVAFLAAACVTAAFWTGAMVLSGQTNQHLEANPRLNTISEPRVLTFQSATPSNSTQAILPLIANNTARIIVPISRTENTSSVGAQPSNGFVFPAGLAIAVTILILLVILVFLFLRLLHDGGNVPPVDTRPRAPPVKSASEAREKRTRQIPINEAESEAKRQDGSLAGAESKRARSIPIDAQEEAREPDDNTK